MRPFVLITLIVLICIGTSAAWNVDRTNENDINCIVSRWRPWGECRYNADYPQFQRCRVRERSIVRNSVGRGTGCPSLINVQECGQPIYNPGSSIGIYGFFPRPNRPTYSIPSGQNNGYDGVDNNPARSPRRGSRRGSGSGKGGSSSGKRGGKKGGSSKSSKSGSNKNWSRGNSSKRRGKKY